MVDWDFFKVSKGKKSTAEATMGRKRHPATVVMTINVFLCRLFNPFLSSKSMFAKLIISFKVKKTD